MTDKKLEKQIDEILDRGVLKDFLPTKEEFKERLLSGEKLKFYMGFDATAKSLHLGHAQNLLVLEDFRRLGHQVIFLIGDFTGMIGDPSDKTSARVKQTVADVQANFKDWRNQVKNIIDFEDEENPFLIKYNSEWLSKLNLAEVLELASNFTVQQMLERDMFENRLKDGKPIYLHEFLYPLMQGYDSVALDVDVEMCGTDQIFNALAGRTLLQKTTGKEKFVIANNLIADEITGQLMSKSNGTGIFLNLESSDLFGAVMSQSDGMIKPLALGCTRLTLGEIEEMTQMENPRDAKIKLAFEITKLFHGEEKAQEAQDYFINTFSKKEIPDDVKIFNSQEGINILELLVTVEGATSKGDARRKVEQGGVSINKEKITDVKYLLQAKDDGKVLKVGKKFFIKLSL
ncbi:MAG: tyrosine--tRNA ligase [Candidatus Moraniibacteriota bacterium]|jgi:tyrosyl-tRNA synthetase